MMAKAVANATTASFITMVGSEFVQKYLGMCGTFGAVWFVINLNYWMCVVWCDVDADV